MEHKWQWNFVMLIITKNLILSGNINAITPSIFKFCLHGLEGRCHYRDSLLTNLCHINYYVAHSLCCANFHFITKLFFRVQYIMIMEKQEIYTIMQ